MKLRLDDIGEEPFRWQTEERVDLTSLGRPEVVSLSPVDWNGTVSPLESGFLLQGRLRYDQTLVCQRCLEPVTETVESGVELMLVRHETGAGEEERELEDKDLGVMVVDGDEVDFTPILESEIQLAIPMRVLCREDCRGLCPTCGANLNEGPCGCRRDGTDPRWSALASLKDRLPPGHER
jgi:uncharacterized protein